MSTRSSKIVTVSIPPETARDFAAIAEQEGRNKSELFREMLRVYAVWRETQQFESLQRYGAAQANRVGIREESDIERLIDDLRKA